MTFTSPNLLKSPSVHNKSEIYMWFNSRLIHWNFCNEIADIRCDVDLFQRNRESDCFGVKDETARREFIDRRHVAAR